MSDSPQSGDDDKSDGSNFPSASPVLGGGSSVSPANNRLAYDRRTRSRAFAARCVPSEDYSEFGASSNAFWRDLICPFVNNIYI